MYSPTETITFLPKVLYCSSKTLLSDGLAFQKFKSIPFEITSIGLFKLYFCSNSLEYSVGVSIKSELL